MVHCIIKMMLKGYIYHQVKMGVDWLGCKTYIKSEENNLVWNTRNCKKKLMMGMQQTKILNCDNLKQKKSTKQEKQNKLKNRWKNKKKIWRFT